VSGVRKDAVHFTADEEIGVPSLEVQLGKRIGRIDTQRVVAGVLLLRVLEGPAHRQAVPELVGAVVACADTVG